MGRGGRGGRHVAKEDTTVTEIGKRPALAGDVGCKLSSEGKDAFITGSAKPNQQKHQGQDRRQITSLWVSFPGAASSSAPALCQEAAPACTAVQCDHARSPSEKWEVEVPWNK